MTETSKPGRIRPGSNYNCQIYPPFGVPTYVSSCTWTTYGSAPGSTAESQIVPAGSGVVTHVRVKVGQFTGPMQVVVLRALRQPNAPPTAGAACCKEVAASDIFTPVANNVTQIDTNFAVRNDLTPDPASGLFNFDALALSVMSTAAAIPLFNTGQFSGNGPIDTGWFPAWQQVGQERADGAGLEGFILLMNADWEPAPVTALRPPGPTTTAVTLGRTTVRLKDGGINLEVDCNQADPCVGIVKVLNQNQPGDVLRGAVASKKKKKKGPVIYGKASFNIPGKSARIVKVKLSAAAKKRVRQHKKATKLWGAFTLNGSKSSLPVVQLWVKRGHHE